MTTPRKPDGRARRLRDAFKLPLRVAVPLVLLVFAGITGLYGLRHYTDIAYHQVEEMSLRGLRVDMDRLQETLEFLLREGNLEQVSHEMTALASDTELLEGYLLDDWGEVVAGTRLDRNGVSLAEMLGSAREADRELRAGVVERALDSLSGIVYVTPDGSRVGGAYPVFWTAAASELRPSRVGVLFIEKDLSAIKAAERGRVENQVLRTSAFLVLLAGGLWLFFDYAVTRRVARLVGATSRLARGDLSARTGVSGRDEIGRVAIAFDRMAEQLQQSRDQLVESEARVLLLLDSAAEAIFGLDADGYCTFCNPACLQALGLEHAGQMLGRKVHDLMHHSHMDGTPHPEDDCRIQQALRTGQPVHVDDEVFWRADGTGFPVEYWSHPIRRRGRAMGSVVTFLDITNRKRADDALRKAKQELEQRVEERTGELTDTNRRLTAEIVERERVELALMQAKEEAETANQAKSEFLSRMSHELRTPMNAILGFAQILESDPSEPLSDNQSESVSEILRAGYHLLELINEVLDLSRIEAGRMDMSFVSMPVGEAVSEALHLVEPLADQFRVSLYDRTGALGEENIWVDPTRMRQVLLNLLSNAVKYNLPEGTVSVYCERRPEGMLRVTVEDTGEGIAESQQRRLFQPFTRLTDDYTRVGGTGIGLTITRRLTELMYGHIGFESSAGVGSRFFVDLLLADAHPMPEGPLQPEAVDGAEPETVTATGTGSVPTGSAPTYNGRRTVLYIEDNQANMELVRRILERRDDLELVAADSAGEGLRAAQARRPDVVLLDIGLPDLDGFEVLRRLRAAQSTQDVPVLAFSGDTLPEDVARGMEAGFFRYLPKPTSIDVLLEAIDEALAVNGPLTRG
ncbi:MAG: ATP-binding protein [Nitrospirota bacterium]|nr:ATP-binding protein [Nitrospirota bacterium]